MKDLVVYNGLTKKQLAVLELLIDPLDKRSEADKARAVGIDPCTLSRWKKNPDFLGKLGDMSLSYLKQRLPEINYALCSEAKKGNVPAMRLVYEILGMHETKLKIQGEIKNMNVNVDLTEEMLYGLAESIQRTTNSSSTKTGEERPILSV